MGVGDFVACIEGIYERERWCQGSDRQLTAGAARVLYRSPEDGITTIPNVNS